MQRIPWLLSIFFALVTATSVAAQEATKWRVEAPRLKGLKNPTRKADKRASIGRGQTLFTEHCLSCHGPRGKGDGPDAADLSHAPADLSSAAVQSQADAELFVKIGEGYVVMPGFATELPAPKRWDVINFLRTLPKVR